MLGTSSNPIQTPGWNNSALSFALSSAKSGSLAEDASCGIRSDDGDTSSAWPDQQIGVVLGIDEGATHALLGLVGEYFASSVAARRACVTDRSP